ncbi:MAG: hypothetical protein ACP5F1_05615 [Thermoplasmata archaeon]|nr:hypothetical protein [Thermoplasmata archaeon]
MTSGLEFEIIAGISIMPVIYVLYDVWKNFEDKFDDRRFFFYLVFGFIAGAILSVFFLMLDYSAMQYIDMTIILIIFFPMVIEMLKFIVFQRKSFVKNYETLFFSYAFGSGLGSAFSLGLVYHLSLGGISNDLFYLIALIFSFEMVLSNSSTGIYIGYGIFSLKRRFYLTNAIIVEFLVFFTLLPYIWVFPFIYDISGIIIAIPFFYYARKLLYSSLEVRK